jgi:hypothetical protein
VVVNDGASVLIIDATISSGVGLDAIIARGSSVLTLQDITVSSLDQSAITVMEGSSATVRGSTATSAAIADAGGTVLVSRNSALHLIGATVISNTTVGPALQAYGNSFFRADDGTGRGFPAEIDTLASTGSAVLIGDLSTGLFKEGAITGNVAVEERGVLRIEKGVETLTITGGITLSQGSTGFFSGPEAASAVARR